MATQKNYDQRKNTIDDQNDEKDLIELCQQMKFSKVQSDLYDDGQKKKILSNIFLENQNSSKNRFLTSLNQKISSKQNILSCLQQKKDKDGPAILLKSKNSINDDKPGQIQLKEKNELHKKINIFGNVVNQTVPNIKFIKKSNLENVSTFSSDSLLFIDSFSCEMKNETQKVSFLLAQRGDFTAFISSIKPQEGYRIRAKLHIDSPIKSLLYIEKDINDSFITMSSQKLVCDKLLIGCQNGFIYVVDSLTEVLQNLIDAQFESDCCIDTNDSDTITKSVDKIILDAYNISRIYVIKQGHHIKRYDYEPTKCQQKEKEVNVNGLKTKYKYKFMQFDPALKLETQSKIICLRFIKLPVKQKMNEQKYKICLLVHLEGMSMPCILDNPDDIYFWFPGQLDRLATRYNKTFEDISGTNKQWDGKHAHEVECSQKIANIKIIEYQHQTGTVIIGCNDGSIYFCSIKRTQQIIKTNFELERQKIEDEQEHNFMLNQQVNKYHCFPYFVVTDFAFREGSDIHSLASIHNQAFVCIATDVKVLLYDTRNRVKFSKTLIQKPSNPINCVTWTMDEQLILSSTKMPSNRVYLYSNQLPIRKIEQK